MKDRLVEHPNRYKLKPVAGENGVYDLEPMPGVVTEVGTPLNKGVLLSDTTADMYKLAGNNATPDKALALAASVAMAENTCFIKVNLCYPGTNTAVPESHRFTLSGGGTSFSFTTNGMDKTRTFYVPLGTYSLVQNSSALLPFVTTNVVGVTLALGDKEKVINAFTYTGDVFIEASTTKIFDIGALNFFNTVKVCVVGGGASGQRVAGGGGGYVTNTEYPVSMLKSGMIVVVGQGGAAGDGRRNGGESSMTIGVTVLKALGGQEINGGSGGGGYNATTYNGQTGGSDGGRGNGTNAGVGQSTSTRIFGEVAMRAGAGGGSGGQYMDGKATIGGEGGYRGGGRGGDVDKMGGNASYYGGGGGGSGDSKWGYDRGQGAGYQGVVALRFVRK